MLYFFSHLIEARSTIRNRWTCCFRAHIDIHFSHLTSTYHTMATAVLIFLRCVFAWHGSGVETKTFLCISIPHLATSLYLCTGWSYLLLALFVAHKKAYWGSIKFSIFLIVQQEYDIFLFGKIGLNPILPLIHAFTKRCKNCLII